VQGTGKKIGTNHWAFVGRRRGGLPKRRIQGGHLRWVKKLMYWGIWNKKKYILALGAHKTRGGLGDGNGTSGSRYPPPVPPEIKVVIRGGVVKP